MLRILIVPSEVVRDTSEGIFRNRVIQFTEGLVDPVEYPLDHVVEEEPNHTQWPVTEPVQDGCFVISWMRNDLFNAVNPTPEIVCKTPVLARPGPSSTAQVLTPFFAQFGGNRIFLDFMFFSEVNLGFLKYGKNIVAEHFPFAQ